MDGSRTPSPMTFVAGSLLAGILVFFSVGIASTSVGCTTADTTPSPDAAPPPCKRGPFLFCTEVAPDQPGCNTADGTSSLLSELPRARYGVGCVVNYVGDRDPQGGDCRLESVCKCVIGQVVTPPTDAGGVEEAGTTDAGDGGDAGPPPPPPPPADPSTTTAPVWQCYP